MIALLRELFPGLFQLLKMLVVLCKFLFVFIIVAPLLLTNYMFHHNIFSSEYITTPQLITLILISIPWYGYFARAYHAPFKAIYDYDKKKKLDREKYHKEYVRECEKLEEERLEWRRNYANISAIVLQKAVNGIPLSEDDKRDMSYCGVWNPVNPIGMLDPDIFSLSAYIKLNTSTYDAYRKFPNLTEKDLAEIKTFDDLKGKTSYEEQKAQQRVNYKNLLASNN